jgi:hypothetical protein
MGAARRHRCATDGLRRAGRDADCPVPVDASLGLADMGQGLRCQAVRRPLQCRGRRYRGDSACDRGGAEIRRRHRPYSGRHLRRERHSARHAGECLAAGRGQGIAAAVRQRVAGRHRYRRAACADLRHRDLRHLSGRREQDRRRHGEHEQRRAGPAHGRRHRSCLGGLLRAADQRHRSRRRAHCRRAERRAVRNQMVFAGRQRAAQRRAGVA